MKIYDLECFILKNLVLGFNRQFMNFIINYFHYVIHSSKYVILANVEKSTSGFLDKMIEDDDSPDGH